MRWWIGKKFVSLNWPSGCCAPSLEVRPACTTPGSVNCTKQQRNGAVETALFLNTTFITDRKTKNVLKIISEVNILLCRTQSWKCAGTWGWGSVLYSRSSLRCSVLCESWMKDVINIGSLTGRLISGGELRKTVNTSTPQKSLEQNSVSTA